MKIKSVLLVIASFVTMFTAVTSATAGEYRYRDGSDYGYYQRPRAEIITRKVWYRNSYGHLCVRYVPVTVIPARACVTEVYEAPVYYHPEPPRRFRWSFRFGF